MHIETPVRSTDDETNLIAEHEQSEEFEEETLSPLRNPKFSARKVVINTALTRYAVVKKIARHFSWRISKTEEDENWDILWTDNAVAPEKLAKMKHYQKINHFPGMYALARKNYLAKNLNRMRKLFAKDFRFFPRTWLIPAEHSELIMQFNGKKQNKVFIVKPEASCQGRGIFLTKKIEDFSMDDRYVVQEYLTRPFLIDNLKFDLRIYVLLAGCDPLRIYLHEEGLARFATEPYNKPNSSNLSHQCMHLTNYAINKNNEDFIFNEDSEVDDVGHKRSLTSTLNQIAEMGYDTKKLWEKIKDIVVKTFCCVQPSLAHTYKACQPDDPCNGMCFEILGFDIILDHKLKPWLLEVNHSPSFTTDSPLDLKIKFEVISQALTLLNINTENKVKYNSKQKREVIERSVTKIGWKNKEKKAVEIVKAQKKRDKWEENHLGGYTKIFECENTEKYQKFIEASAGLWEEWTAGKGKAKNAEKAEKLEKLEIKSTPKPYIATKVSKSKISSVRQSKTCYTQILKKDQRESESSISKIPVYDKIAQLPGKKPNTLDQNLFPSVKFDNMSGYSPVLPSFMDFNFSNNKLEKTPQRPIRVIDKEKCTSYSFTKDSQKFKDFPLMIQSILGPDNNTHSIDKFSSKSRNLTPSIRKTPYLYNSSLSYKK